MTEQTETSAVGILAPRGNASGSAAALLFEMERGRQNHTLADVQDVTSGGIVVFLPAPLEVGRTCTLRWGPATEQVIIHHCERRPNGFLAVLRMVRQERRKEERLRTAGRATLFFAGSGGRRAVVVTVTNISQGGLQVEMEEPVDVPQTVRLCGVDLECMGLMRYCCRDGERFLAGLQFTRRPHIRRLPANFA